MQEFKSLIAKYNNRTATKDELLKLIDHLDQQEHLLLEDWMQELKQPCHNQGGDFLNFDRQKVKALILMQTGSTRLQAPKRNVLNIAYYMRAVAMAAAFIGIIFLTGYYLIPTAINKENNLTHKEYYTFRALNSQKNITLEDGSTVILYSGSTLQYDSLYNKTERKLKLKGKGRFHVKSDATRPFIVASLHLTTTALGTTFEVTENQDNTIVYLLEGLVKVQTNNQPDAKPVYLSQGQSVINLAGQSINTIVPMPANGGKTKDKKELNKATIKAPAGDLIFKQTPLEEVLKTLESKYKTKIRFAESELSGMLFTGDFNKDQNIHEIIRLIATINGLKVSVDQTGFTVKK